MEGRGVVHNEEWSETSASTIHDDNIATIRNIVEAECRVTIDEILTLLHRRTEVGR